MLLVEVVAMVKLLGLGPLLASSARPGVARRWTGGGRATREADTELEGSAGPGLTGMHAAGGRLATRRPGSGGDCLA